MKSFDIALCLDDGLFQFVGHQRSGTLKLGLGNEEIIGASAVYFLRNGTEGAVTAILDTQEYSPYTRLNDTIVKFSTLA